MTARGAVLLIGLLTVRLCSAGGTAGFNARLEPTPPFPGLQAAARAKGIPLEGVDRPGASEALSPGDSVTTLITLHEKGHRRTQWVIYLEAVAAPNPHQAADSNGAGSKPPARAAAVMYTSMSNRFEFADAPATIRLRTIGPFVEPNSRWKQPPPKDDSARVTVNRVFLGLGLDQGAAALSRVAKLRRRDKGIGDSWFSVSAKPFNAPEIERGRKMAARLHITPEEERALAGGVPALFSYFDTIRQTPDLESIFRRVVSMPSMWAMLKSFIKSHGISARIAIGHPDDRLGSVALPGWDLGTNPPLCSLPVDVTLCGHHALVLTLIVTAPHPPFLACGGIVGFLAENPQDKDNYLAFRVIAAHCRSPQ